MRFSRLRLAGFKSFVEPADLSIEAGLTGVVGPNGCGKSNLVEALRWVMGESSARQMRGGEMDDMIFGGSVGRPARNLAEVTLSVDNSARMAHAAFNDRDTLDITRRIDRGKGSSYRVNGREVRARDVQLLFADAATGARSASLVSQGQVGKLIGAQPSERRSLLEEAAGISGLHARRHEAEQRLKAAEANLERLEDVLATLRQQLEGLKRQARQAARYRQLSERIEQAEACLLAARWQEIAQAQTLAAHEAQAAILAVAQAERNSTLAAAQQAQASALLPVLRQAEVKAIEALQKEEQALVKLEAEERRIEQTRLVLQTQYRQVRDDIERERHIEDDAKATLERLSEEARALSCERMDEALEQEEAQDRLEEANSAVDEAELEVSERAGVVALNEAQRDGLTKRLSELERRNLRLSAELEDIEAKRDRQAEELATYDEAEDEQALMAAETLLETALQALATAEEQRQTTDAALEAAHRLLRAFEGRASRIQGEIDGIAASLSLEPTDRQTASNPQTLLDLLTVTPGYEAAFGALLGDDLMANPHDDDKGAAHWRDLPKMTQDGRPVGELAQNIQAPATLCRRLAFASLSEDLAQALSQQADLQPGERLVTLAGDLVRWDGFVQPAGAPSLAATRLTLRNRLAALQLEQEQLAAEGKQLAERAQQAHYAANAALSFERRARANERQAAQSLADLREDAAKRRLSVEKNRNRLIALEQALERLARDCAENDQETVDALERRERIGDLAQAREELAAARALLTQKRAVALAARTNRDRLQRESAQRTQRLAAISREIQEWRQRADAACSRVRDLGERLLATEKELERLAHVPEDLAEQRHALLCQLETLRQARFTTGDRRAEEEEHVRKHDLALRAAEAEMAAKREASVRAQGLVEMAARDAVSLNERIRRRFECSSEELHSFTGLAQGAPLPDPAQSQAHLDSRTREREAMGPVNLRAESEVAAGQAQIDAIASESDDLQTAIARLRSAIAAINREGRERLLTSFEQVNRHFDSLFTRLFGGGKARLSLSENDDPLMAGLEILASPPGKTPKILSLLSGGESALTALALIFAVFLTNPSPICVLDEVDAPLDDSNVDRFCRLLAEIAEQTDTRFLVVTHHRMTMARMDRLFGVTMVERGVSQLVSVDLNRAEKLAPPPHAA